MLVKSWRHVLKYTQRHVAGCHLICLVWLWVGENKKLPVKVEKGQWAWCFVGKVFPKHGSNFQEQPEAWRKKQKHVELRFLELWNVMNMSSLVRDHVFIQSFDCWRFCGHIIISKKEVQTRHHTSLSKPFFFPYIRHLPVCNAEATSLICLGHLRQEDSKAAERVAREALSMFQVRGWM